MMFKFSIFLKNNWFGNLKNLENPVILKYPEIQKTPKFQKSEKTQNSKELQINPKGSEIKK